jgi:tetratricopeptide (TPR) repeat protein
MYQYNFVKNSVRLALLFICLSAVWPPTTLHAQTQENIQELKQKAARLMEQQKYTEALPILEMLAVAEPDNPETRFHLGFALIAQANSTKDVEQRKVLRVRARNAFIKSKELGNNEPLVNALIHDIPPDGSEGRVFSQNAEANKLMTEAEALFSQGKLDNALKNYQTALQLDPKIYEAALFSGDVYTHRGDFKQAEIWYQKAIEIDANRETAYRYSATPLMKQGKYDQARDRYVEAYITEPYSRFSMTGLTQWAQATSTTLAHPEIDIPVKVTFDESGEAKIDLSGDALLLSRESGSFAWTSYGATRSAWRKEKFAKTFPQEKTYRHSLAEEAEALRGVLKLATGDKNVKNLSPSLAKLKKLDDEGLLEAYILLARADPGIAQDHRAYLGQNREKLRRYTVEYVLAGAGSSQIKEATDGKKRVKHDEKIERKYDKSKDQTTVRLQMTPITCVRDGCIFFSLESSFAGSKPESAMNRFVLALYIFTKTLVPFSDPILRARIDGETIELGSMTFAGREEKDGLAGMAYGIILDEKILAKLANARRLEMRIGSIQFPLGDNKLSAIADFYGQATVSQ